MLRVRLGVCTNKLETLSVLLLEALDLTKYFGSVVDRHAGDRQAGPPPPSTSRVIENG